LSRVRVTKNKKIKQGDTVGFVGSTGKSSAPHLHFELLIDGQQVDPLLYLL
jgi:murein DD-endopeptidase MepM/ murein hydrolase activator NlpD